MQSLAKSSRNRPVLPWTVENGKRVGSIESRGVAHPRKLTFLIFTYSK